MCITTNVHVYGKIPYMNQIDWNELIWSRKEVKSSDQYVCGNVMAEYKDKIIIIIIEGDTIKSHEYIIPKSKVDYYDKMIFILIFLDMI